MEQQDDDLVALFFILNSGDNSISGPYLASDDLSQILTSDDGTQTLTPN